VNGRIVLVRTMRGRWVWWPALQVVDYIPAGKRTPKWSFTLASSQNTEVGALRAIVHRLSGDRA